MASMHNVRSIFVARLRMTYEDEGIDNGGFAVYRFSLNKKTYRMEHTLSYRPSWTLDMETSTGYLSVAVGRDAVKQWLASHGITGIL